MLRSVALLLVAVVGVHAAGHVGSVDVFRGGLIEWTFEDTMYEISSKQTSSGGDRFFDPRSIEFRLPSPSRRFRLVTTFRLARNKNNRVKTFRVNGNTFKVRYNKKGRKVTRVTCKSGPSCPRKRNLLESDEPLTEKVEDIPSHRKTQSMIDWTCDSCGDFWDSICDARGISLLCDSKGTTAVSKLRDRFATRAVNTLCGAVSDVCGEFEEDGSEEICFFSFEAEECDVVIPEPSAEPTSGPTSFPTSSPTQLDADAVEAAADFAGEVGEALFPDEDLGAIPSFEVGELAAGDLEITSSQGTSTSVSIGELEVVDDMNLDESVEDSIPEDVSLTAEDLALAGDLVSTQSASVGAGDSEVGALAFVVDVSSITGEAEGSQGTLLSMIGDDSIFNAPSTSRHLVHEDAVMTTIHLRALELQRSLQADNGCMSEIVDGVSDGQESFPCPDGEGPRAIDSCVDGAFEDSGAAALVAQAEARNLARINAGRPALRSCLQRARRSYFQFSNRLALFCFITSFLPAIREGRSFAEAAARFAACLAGFSEIIARFGLALVSSCNAAFRIDVVFPSETELALDNAAACSTARDFVEEECFQCVPEGSLRF